MKNILFRVDSSSFIGLGHVMRCLTLALRLKELKNNYKISFATLLLQGNINKEILNKGFELISLKNKEEEELSKILSEKKIDLLIFDSYDITYDFEKIIKNKFKNLKVLSFDDIYEEHYSDMILNHGLQANDKLYDSNKKLFIGEEYTLLRDEFYKYTELNEVKSINKFLIILGGADIKNYSLSLCKKLKEVSKDFEITILTTSSNRYLEELKNNQKTWKYTLEVDAKNVAEFMTVNDLIVTTTSTTLYEVIFLKKLFINITLSENQEYLDLYLKDKGLDYSLINIDKNEILTLLNKINNEKESIYKQLSSFNFSKYKLANEIIMELEK